MATKPARWQWRHNAANELHRSTSALRPDLETDTEPNRALADSAAGKTRKRNCGKCFDADNSVVDDYFVSQYGILGLALDEAGHVYAAVDSAANAGDHSGDTVHRRRREQFELLDTLVGDAYAALYFRITAKRSGREPLDDLTLHLARFDGALIAEIWFHNFDTQTVAAFWK